MLALHGRPSDVDVFAFFLAGELGMTVARLESELTHAEYVQWVAYHKARKAIGDQRRVT